MDRSTKVLRAFPAVPALLPDCVPLRKTLLSILGVIVLICCVAIPCQGETARSAENVFVGSDACKPCHPEEYESFISFAKKSRSYQSVEKLKTRLTEDEVRKCYSCHTTGYGMPGGFVSDEETPHLKNAGCEVCHGPGSFHLTSGDKTDIKRDLTTDDCVACHISERIKAFRYKPMIHGGAH
ncbi:cytochrome c family protein [Thermodesulfobacteriota bacterium]